MARAVPRGAKASWLHCAAPAFKRASSSPAYPDLEMRDSALLSARVLAWLLIMPCCAAAAAGGDAAAGGRVTSLSAETFAQFVNGSAVSLVEFYAPWCGLPLPHSLFGVRAVVRRAPRLYSRLLRRA